MTYVLPEHPGLSLVLEKVPEVFVLDSDKLHGPEDDGYADPFVEDLVAATGALILAIPGGKLEAMTLADAKLAMQAIIDKEEATS